MERAQMIDEVLDMVAKIASLDKASIRADMPLMGKRIGLDSIKMVRLLIDLEDHFPERMRTSNINNLDFSTVDTLVDFLIEKSG